MLTLYTDGCSSNCAGLRRRELLRVGTLGIGGITLSGLLRTKAVAAGMKHDVVKDRAIVVLNMQGGPTQFETFDPKMSAPSEYRAMFGDVKTKIPGISFGSHLEKLAAMADKLAVVRSYRHGISSHGTAAKHVAAGGNPTGACLGSIYSRIAGITNPQTGIPNHTLVIPAAIDEKYKKFNAVPSRVTDLGNLSSAYKAFDPSAGGDIVENMKLHVSQHRLDDRRMLLANLDGLKRKLDENDALAGADSFQQQAFDVILGGISSAFEISREDPKLIARYDTSRFKVTEKAIQRRRNKKGFIQGHSPISLGKQMLMARRLVEAGCGFVTVTSAGWDMHGQHEFDINDGIPILCPAVDRAVSAFLEDLEERGLEKKVLLVTTGEFGRTPRINKDLGRDHWGNLCPLVFAGGGLPMGQVIGQSDRTASAPSSDPISSANVTATLMGAVLDLGKVRLMDGLPMDIRRALTEATPIPQLG